MTNFVYLFLTDMDMIMDTITMDMGMTITMMITMVAMGMTITIHMGECIFQKKKKKVSKNTWIECIKIYKVGNCFHERADF